MRVLAKAATEIDGAIGVAGELLRAELLQSRDRADLPGLRVPDPVVRQAQHEHVPPPCVDLASEALPLLGTVRKAVDEHHRVLRLRAVRVRAAQAVRDHDFSLLRADGFELGLCARVRGDRARIRRETRGRRRPQRDREGHREEHQEHDPCPLEHASDDTHGRRDRTPTLTRSIENHVPLDAGACHTRTQTERSRR